MSPKVKIVINQYRWVIPAVISAIILVPDENSRVLLFSLGIILGILSITHVLRKLVFPYIKLESIVANACTNPIGASIIFASIIYLVTIVIQSSVLLIK